MTEGRSGVRGDHCVEGVTFIKRTSHVVVFFEISVFMEVFITSAVDLINNLQDAAFTEEFTKTIENI